VALQISKGADEKAVRERYQINSEIALVKFSDSHYPDDLGKIYTLFEIEEPTFEEIRKALKGMEGRKSLIADPSPKEKGV
jgi:PHP family Zn ribbon phosphoesterase